MDNLTAVFQWGLRAKVDDFPQAVAATHFNYLEQSLGWNEADPSEDGPSVIWEPSSLTGQLSHGWKCLLPDEPLSEAQRIEYLGHWLASFEVASRIGVALWLKPAEFRLAQQNISFLLMFSSRIKGLSASHLANAVEITLAHFSHGSPKPDTGASFDSPVDVSIQGRLRVALINEVINIVLQEGAANRGYLGTSRIRSDSPVN